jgi:hypothetical protein
MNTLGERDEQNEQRTMFVVAFTAAIMAAEITGETSSD